MRSGICCNLYSTVPDTHYDVLELKKNCTPKEIRSAFIRLSKEFHPDKNPNNPALHDKFVQLNEAYSTLNDIESRRNYDASLNLRTVINNMSVHRKDKKESPFSTGRPENWKEYYDFEAQLRRNEAIHVPNFLYKFSTLSRAALVILLLGVTTALFGLQILSVYFSRTNAKDVIRSKDLEIANNLMMARSNAQKYDLQQNLDRFSKLAEKSQSRRPDL